MRSMNKEPKEMIRKGYLLLMALFVGLSAVAQNQEIFDVRDFDKINMKIDGTVYIKQGDTNEVVVEGDRDDLEKMDISVEGGELIIDTRNRSSWRFWDSWSVDVEVYVTVKELRSVSVSGSGDVISQNTIEAENFRARISGSGDIEMDLDVRDIEASISGSGDIELSGKSESGRLSISGSGKFLSEDMEVGDFNVRMSGSGRCAITVNGELDVRISGSGSVYYGGRPTGINTNVSGSGKVRRID
jgi:hypothetical protein